jgi:hypothetical protein
MSSTLLSRDKNIHFVTVNYLFRYHKFIDILAGPSRGIDPYQMAIDILPPEETRRLQTKQRVPKPNSTPPR